MYYVDNHPTTEPFFLLRDCSRIFENLTVDSVDFYEFFSWFGKNMIFKEKTRIYKVWEVEKRGKVEIFTLLGGTEMIFKKKGGGHIYQSF